MSSQVPAFPTRAERGEVCPSGLLAADGALQDLSVIGLERLSESENNRTHGA